MKMPPRGSVALILIFAFATLSACSVQHEQSVITAEELQEYVAQQDARKEARQEELAWQTVQASIDRENALLNQ